MSSVSCYPDKAPKVDRLLNTLSDSVRREVVHYFEAVAGEDAASVDELVAFVDGRDPRTDADQVRRVLHHVHLPKLAERGWISYDDRSGDVRYYGHGNAGEILDEIAEVFAE